MRLTRIRGSAGSCPTGRSRSASGTPGGRRAGGGREAMKASGGGAFEGVTGCCGGRMCVRARVLRPLPRALPPPPPAAARLGISAGSTTTGCSRACAPAHSAVIGAPTTRGVAGAALCGHRVRASLSSQCGVPRPSRANAGGLARRDPRQPRGDGTVLGKDAIPRGVSARQPFAAPLSCAISARPLRRSALRGAASHLVSRSRCCARFGPAGLSKTASTRGQKRFGR